MTQNLNDFLRLMHDKKYAVTNGTAVHAMLQHVVLGDNEDCGDKQLIAEIKKHNELKCFFRPDAKTEVPIAGLINSVFVSRRIDRLVVDESTKTIQFIDYKTDANKTDFVDKYVRQIKEYATLLCSAYPNYKVNGFILWVHDWQLEQIV